MPVLMKYTCIIKRNKIVLNINQYKTVLNLELK